MCGVAVAKGAELDDDAEAAEANEADEMSFGRGRIRENLVESSAPPPMQWQWWLRRKSSPTHISFSITVQFLVVFWI